MDYNAGDFAISLRLILRSRVERAGEEYCEDIVEIMKKYFFQLIMNMKEHFKILLLKTIF